MEEKFCSICFDNENDEKIISLQCNHIFHFDCINEWYKKGDSKKFDRVLTCPYCRTIAIITNIPIKYDCFFKFYYFTHFKREMCIVNNCQNKEFPLNHKVCSKHMYPLINRDDLNKVMNYLFPFFFMPLNIKKFLLKFCVELYYYNLSVDTYVPKILVEIKNFLLQNDFLPKTFELSFIFYELKTKFPELKPINIEYEKLDLYF